MEGDKISTSSIVDSVMKVRILVVDEDSKCLANTSAALQVFNYEVVTTKCPVEAMSIIRVHEGSFDIVISDVQMTLMTGLALQKIVEDQFQIPVILMSSNDKSSLSSESVDTKTTFLITKPPSIDDVKNIWEYVASRRREMEEDSPPKGDSSQKEVESRNCDKAIISPNDQEGTKSSSVEVCEKDKGKNSRVSKKPKITWTAPLHNRFVEAIRVIGPGRAFPKRILEYMNVQGLRREHIASHLQKFRLYARRNNELKELPSAMNNMHMPNYSWSQFANDDGMINYSNTSNFNQQQDSIAPIYNHGNLEGNNMPPFNPSYIDSQGLSMLNSQQNTFMQSPMNNIIGNNFLHDNSNYNNSTSYVDYQGLSMLNSQQNTFMQSPMNNIGNNLLYDTSNYNNSTSNMNPFESTSMFDGQNNMNLGNNGNSTTAPMQFNETNINNDGLGVMNTQATQEGTHYSLYIPTANFNQLETNNLTMMPNQPVQEQANGIQESELFGLVDDNGIGNACNITPQPQLVSHDVPYFSGNLDTMPGMLGNHNGGTWSDFNNQIIPQQSINTGVNLMPDPLQVVTESNDFPAFQQMGMMSNFNNITPTFDQPFNVTDDFFAPQDLNMFGSSNNMSYAPQPTFPFDTQNISIDPSINLLSDMNNHLPVDQSWNNHLPVEQSWIASDIATATINDASKISTDMNNIYTMDQPVLMPNMNYIPNGEEAVGNDVDTTFQMPSNLDKDMPTFDFACTTPPDCPPSQLNDLSMILQDYDIEDLSTIFPSTNGENEKNM